MDGSHSSNKKAAASRLLSEPACQRAMAATVKSENISTALKTDG